MPSPSQQLQQIMNMFAYQKIELETFKKSAMSLVEQGADLKITDTSNAGNSLLHHLILTNQQNNNDNEISELLGLNKDLINIKDGYGRIPLQSLLRKKANTQLNEVEQLRLLGSDLHNTDKNGETLLHACCYSGNFQVVSYLVQKGLNLGAKTNNGQTMLHYSALHTNIPLWQYLLENKVNIDEQDDSRLTALHLAVMYNHSDMVKWLIQNNANNELKNNEGKTALAFAHDYKNKELISLLSFTRSTKVNNKNSNPDKINQPSPNQLFATKETIPPESNTNPENSSKENKKNSTLNNQPSHNQLFVAIEALRSYGKKLKNKGASKGQVAIDLANKLQSMAEDFFKQDEQTQATNLPHFKKLFSITLNSKSAEMSTYRTSWDTIIANIAIALTGIGAAFIIGNLLYTQATQGRALFFFQKSKTTCEEKIEAVAQSTAALN